MLLFTTVCFGMILCPIFTAWFFISIPVKYQRNLPSVAANSNSGLRDAQTDSSFNHRCFLKQMDSILI